MKILKNVLFLTMLLTIALVSSCISAVAAPISNYPISLTQPNGSLINCYVSGDEFFNYIHDLYGNIIMKNPDSGYYVYAEIANDGILKASDDKVLSVNFYDNGNILYDDSITEERVRIEDINFDINSDFVWNAEGDDNSNFPIEQQSDSESIGIVKSNPIEGTLENIIVMICFSDEDPKIDSIIEEKIESSYNGTENSLKDYIQSISEGVVELNSTIVGSGNDSVLMYQDVHPRAYYSPYDATTNPDGYQGGNNGSERTNREHELLKNAINAISDSDVLAGKNLDITEDGYVDCITFIVNGDVNGWSSLLWPHKWSLYSYNVKLNDARVYNYNFQLLDYLFPQNSSTNLGVICHETLHVFGLPDLYRYTYNGTPVGRWDIMASNDSTRPQIPNTHSLLRYTGWGDIPTEITRNGTYELAPLGDKDGTTAYAIKTCNDNEYILLEYRNSNNDSAYDKIYNETSSSYKAGLIISRINTSFSGNANRNGGTNDEVYVYRPNEIGYNLGKGNIQLASLSSNVNRTSFGNSIDDMGYDSIYLYDGNNTKYIISNVSELGDTISFDIVIEENIDITEEFTDSNFLSVVRDLVGSEQIHKYDVINITSLDIINKDINNLDGIEYFEDLKELNCYANNFENLHLSNNKELEILDCSFNMNMTTLDISKNTKLKELYCNYAQLTTLDIASNSELTNLVCFYNPLGTLDVSQNYKLQELDCRDIGLTNLDVSNNKSLTYLNCSFNNMSSINDVIGWRELGLVLGETFKFDPQH